MSEMIERVAYAIRRSMEDWHRSSRGDAYPGESMPDAEMARAAIQAMREPTDAMIEAGRETYCEHGDMQCGCDNSWRAMIDAATRT